MTVLEQAEQAQALPNSLDSKDNFPAWPPAPKAAPVTTAPEVKISEQLSMPGANQIE